MPDKFFVGPKFIADVNRTVTRVDALPQANGGLPPPATPKEALHAMTSFKVATATGPWALDGDKAVSFSRGTTTATLVATNIFHQGLGCAFTSDTDYSYNVGVARHSTAWYLVTVPLEFTNKTVLDDISLNVELNTSNCSITVDKTLHTSLMEYAKLSLACPTTTYE